MRLSGDVLKMDLYGILEVSQRADTRQVRAAYRRKVLQSHPDLNRDNLSQAERDTVDLNVAVWVLSDPELREQYDSRRKAAGRSLAWYERGSRGSEEWVTPPKRKRASIPPRGELGQLLRRIRQWPGRVMLELSEWAEGLSMRERTTLTAFCFVAAALLISYAKPTSLTKLFEEDRVASESR